MIVIFLVGLTADDFIVQIYNYALPNKVLKRLVHEGEKSEWRIVHTKVHDTIFKKPVACAEGHLVFVPRGNADLVVYGGKVNHTEELGPGQGIKQVFDMRKRMLILEGYGVKGAVVLY